MNAPPRLARTLAWLTASLSVLATTGLLYQVVATRSDRRKYPAPGRLVDVGGHRLHVHCLGQGSPTVILEAAADMMSADWAWIQPQVAKRTRVCAYDRAGMGWSEPGPPPRDGRRVSNELHALLTNAGIAGPYVLVGHSAGGLYVRTYAAHHAQEVVGMLLVDPGHPDMAARIPELETQRARDAQLVGAMQILSHLGVLRWLGIGSANAAGLPPRQTAEVSAFVSTPQHWATMRALIDATPATYQEARAAPSLDGRPLVVVSASTAWFDPGAPADDARRLLNELHADLAALSADGCHRVVEGATHGSLVHDRDDAQAIIVAIDAVLTALRTGLPLTPCSPGHGSGVRLKEP